MRWDEIFLKIDVIKYVTIGIIQIRTICNKNL